MEEKLKLNNFINKWYLFEEDIEVGISKKRKKLGAVSGNLLMFKSYEKNSSRPYEVVLTGGKKSSNFLATKKYLDSLFINGNKNYKEVEVNELTYENIKRINNKIGILHDFIMFSDEDVSVFKNPHTYGNLLNELSSDSELKINFKIYGRVNENISFGIMNKLEQYRFNIQDILINDDNKLGEIITPNDYFKYLDGFNVGKEFGFGIKLFNIGKKTYFDMNLEKLNGLDEVNKKNIIRKEIEILLSSGVNIFKTISLDESSSLFKLSLDYFDKNEINVFLNSIENDFKINDYEILEFFIKKNDVENFGKCLSLFSSIFNNKKAAFIKILPTIVNSAEIAEVILNSGLGGRDLLRQSKNKEVVFKSLDFFKQLQIDDLISQFLFGSGDMAMDLLKKEKVFLKSMVDDKEIASIFFNEMFNHKDFSIRLFKKHVFELKKIGVKSPKIDLVIKMFKIGKITEYNFLLNNVKFSNEDYNELFVGITHQHYGTKKTTVSQGFLKILSEVDYVQDFSKLLSAINRSDRDFILNEELFNVFMRKIDPVQDINDFFGNDHNMALALAYHDHNSLFKSFVVNYGPDLNVQSMSDFNQDEKIVKNILFYLNKKSSNDSRLNSFEEAIKYGALIDSGGEEPLLYMAMRNSNLKIANIVLKNSNKVDMLYIDKNNGNNLLHIFCDKLFFLERNYNDKNFAMKFVENIMKVVDLNKKNNNGDTPLDIISKRCGSHNEDFINNIISKIQFAILEKNINKNDTVSKKVKI